MDVAHSFLNSVEARIPHQYFRAFGWIGMLAVTSKLAMLLYSARKLFWTQKDLLKRYGVNTWVLITGGAKGVGRSFALEFAKLGFNILVLDDDELAFQRLGQEIQVLNPNIRFKAIRCDFCRVNEEGFFDEIDMVLRDLDISVLVNNVGKEKAVGNFEKLEFEEIRKVSTLNILPQVLLSHKCIQKFLHRPKQFKSAIINMSSITSCNPSRYWQLTASTKAFNLAFSLALSKEYEDRMDILAVKAGLISTPLTGYMSGFGVVDAEDVVRATMTKLGHTNVTHGHWMHSMLGPFAMTESVQAMLYNQVVAHNRKSIGAKGKIADHSSNPLGATRTFFT